MVTLRKRQKAVIAAVLVSLLTFSSMAYLRSSTSAQTGGAGESLQAVVYTAASNPDASRYIAEYHVGGANSQPNALASIGL